MNAFASRSDIPRKVHGGTAVPHASSGNRFGTSLGRKKTNTVVYELQKESAEYQTPTLEPAYSQLASRRKTVCCTIASLTEYGLFQQSQQSLLITREVWL
jgi:hypothetical protein